MQAHTKIPSPCPLISFDELPLLTYPQPSPFFEPEDQLYKDTEDDQIPEDEDEARFKLTIVNF
jgi:hypothetical protein